MKSIILLLLFILTVPVFSELKEETKQLLEISSPVEYKEQAFDVLHYDVLCIFTEAPSKEMSGSCTISFVWTEDPEGKLFYFHLRDLQIYSIRYDNGATANYQVNETPSSPTYHYSLSPLAEHKKWDTARIIIEYGGTMTGEKGQMPFGGVQNSTTGLYSMGVGFSLNYVSATHHWMPCYDHPSDKATFRGKFAVRYDKFAASVGELVDVQIGSFTNYYTWETNYPVATYLLTFAVDEYIPVEFEGSSVPAVVYCRRGDSLAISHTFKLLPRMVGAYEELFGKYPFEKAGYCMTKMGAMEHQTMVSYPIDYARYLYSIRDTVNEIAAHELAHQWFGNLVSPLDFRHAWLNEAFATYCEALWLEHLFGKESYLKKITDDINRYAKNLVKSEGAFPLFDYPRESPSSNYPGTIYYKGSSVVSMLRFKLSDEVFFGAIREYLRIAEHGNATSEMLKKTLEEYSKVNLDYFFERWVYQQGFPQLEINSFRRSDGGNYSAIVDIRQNQPKSWGGFAELPIEIGFRLTDGSYIYRIVEMNQTEESWQFDGLPEFTDVNINQGPTFRTLLEVVKQNFTSAEENDNDNNLIISLSPNPVSLNATVYISGIIGKCKVSVFNSLGYVVFKTEKSSDGLDALFTIPTYNLPPGMYYICAESGADRRWAKFIVVN